MKLKVLVIIAVVIGVATVVCFTLYFAGVGSQSAQATVEVQVPVSLDNCSMDEFVEKLNDHIGDNEKIAFLRKTKEEDDYTLGYYEFNSGLMLTIPELPDGKIEMVIISNQADITQSRIIEMQHYAKAVSLTIENDPTKANTIMARTGADDPSNYNKGYLEGFLSQNAYYSFGYSEDTKGMIFLAMSLPRYDEMLETELNQTG